MKNFWKMTLATVVGLLLFSIVCTGISIFFFVAIAASTSQTTVIKQDAVYHLKLKGSVVDRVDSDEYAEFMSVFSKTDKPIALDDFKATLIEAANNDNIHGVYLEVGSLSAAPASIQAMRSALQDFKESGKFIVAYADNYSQNTYWISSIADKVYLNPMGNVMLYGVNMSGFYFGETLKKIGVKMQVFRVGTFKSAVEPYVSDHMSEANKLQMSSLANGIWSAMLTDIAESRKLTVEQLQAFADNGDFMAETEIALQKGLVDSLCYESAMNDVLENLVGNKPNKYSLSKIKSTITPEKYKQNKIAVLYASGAIDGGSKEGIDSEDICQELQKLAKDSSVKAVVLRINSPGGSAFGSEQMWHAAQMLKEKKPLVVSMGDYAASGGYYMACNANKIVAEPTTLTGSIGIFSIIPDAQGLFDKVGLAIDGVSTAKYAAMGDISKPMTTDEKILFQNTVNRGYELFVKRCAQGRDMTIDEIKKVAEGRVWLGEQALKLGLVDELGGLDKAVAIAAELAEVDKYAVKEYPAKKDLFTKIMEDFQMNASARVMAKQLGEYAAYYEAFQKANAAMGIQARIPYEIIFE